MILVGSRSGRQRYSQVTSASRANIFTAVPPWITVACTVEWGGSKRGSASARSSSHTLSSSATNSHLGGLADDGKRRFEVLRFQIVQQAFDPDTAHFLVIGQREMDRLFQF